ncbi:MAG: phosphosulfolactate synthase [Peptococcaceae bacterium BICA1-7]|nr:MAG: phosphosulfolactate synthase [Peptococcaceae bacterium BICA1-7]HBV98728.1 phosphosulfolactate synthase [Desulfotomaculum sp.]
MDSLNNSIIWRDVIKYPLGDRNCKPRTQGLTMIIDKGMGLAETKDLLNIAGGHIDFIKLAFGTSALYNNNVLPEKIELARSQGIDIYPGGTFLEVALIQDRLEEFYQLCKSLGFTCVEVSDGTINLEREVRERAISRASDMGFLVLTEVGKKDVNDQTPVEEFAAQIKSDLKNGAFKVILEGRETGANVGLYDENGNFIKDDLERLLGEIEDPRIIMWEAPNKDQQLELISRFGPNVNLGNIPTREVLALEALRVGLRSDSFRITLNNAGG